MNKWHLSSYDENSFKTCPLINPAHGNTRMAIVNVDGSNLTAQNYCCVTTSIIATAGITSRLKCAPHMVVSIVHYYIIIHYTHQFLFKPTWLTADGRTLFFSTDYFRMQHQRCWSSLLLNNANFDLMFIIKSWWLQKMKVIKLMYQVWQAYKQNNISKK